MLQWACSDAIAHAGTLTNLANYIQMQAPPNLLTTDNPSYLAISDYHENRAILRTLVTDWQSVVGVKNSPSEVNDRSLIGVLWK
jgi:hypothetical protein